jgi:hypothetical protein
MDQVRTMESAMELGEWIKYVLSNSQWNCENGQRIYYRIYKGIGRMDQLHTMESTRELGEWTENIQLNLQ